MRNVKNEETTERFWSPAKCAEKLLEHTSIDETIWDLRGEVFETLKQMKKFPEGSVGSEHQATVDAVIRRLLEAV